MEGHLGRIGEDDIDRARMPPALAVDDLHHRAVSGENAERRAEAEPPRAPARPSACAESFHRADRAQRDQRLPPSVGSRSTQSVPMSLTRPVMRCQPEAATVTEPS